MARINLRLPPRLASGFKIGPEFKTPTVTGSNGFEYRNRNWLYGRFRAEGSYAAFNVSEQEELERIYQATAGMWAAFRVRDRTLPSRYKVANEPIYPNIGTDDPCQVIRTYTWGLSTKRIIQALYDDDFTLKKDGVEFTAYTLDDELGLVTPDSAWEAGDYTWSGKHDLWMRFNSDWAAAIVIKQGIATADIGLVEDRQR